MMYNIEKRKQFNTVGELKKLLENIPDETQIVITGDDYCWFHIEEDETVVNLDTEDLDDECYLGCRCNWCEKLFDKSEGKRELNMGFLCNRCIDALWSRGEKLTLVEEL